MARRAEADDISVAATNTDENRKLVADALSLLQSCEQALVKVISENERSEYKTTVQCRATDAEPRSFHSPVSTFMTARKRLLREPRSHCCTENECEMDKSSQQFMEVGGPSSELDLLHVANHRYFHECLAKRWPFFRDYGHSLQVGRKIAEGGQAEIFEATIDGKPYMLKVFKGYLLEDLEQNWTLTHVVESSKLVDCLYSQDDKYLCFLKAGTLLKDGSFAFVMERYWGDLHTLISLWMEENNHQGPPFQFPTDIMLQIARGMRSIHQHRILHRDLKASNVLLVRLGTADGDDLDAVQRALRAEQFGCFVADFDCCGGAMGTRAWRAPEVLLALEHRDFKLQKCTEKIDVYSYAVTCYEILTGCNPQEFLANGNEYDAVVVRGERPPLPDYVDYRVQELLKRCWHPEPSQRPTFNGIVNDLEDLMHSVAAFIRPVHLESWYRLLGDDPTLDEILSISKCTILIPAPGDPVTD